MKHVLVIITLTKIFNQGLSKDGLFYIFKKGGEYDVEVANNFEAYVKAYCIKHGLMMEEAMKHELIREVKKYYERGENK